MVDRCFPPDVARAWHGKGAVQSARACRPGARCRPAGYALRECSRALLAASKPRASFMFAGCCWWRSLAVDGYSGASQGHAPVVRRPSSWRSCADERPCVFQPLPACPPVSRTFLHLRRYAWCGLCLYRQGPLLLSELLSSAGNRVRQSMSATAPPGRPRRGTLL